jgi:hypothetical protein
VVGVTDELRAKGEEPILRFDDFWVLATTQMIEEYGKPFRDIQEFRQACAFLHENGKQHNQLNSLKSCQS